MSEIQFPTYAETQAAEQAGRAARHRRPTNRNKAQDWSGHVESVTIEPKISKAEKPYNLIYLRVSNLVVTRSIEPVYATETEFDMFFPDKMGTQFEFAQMTRSATELDPTIQRLTDLIGRDITVKEETYLGSEKQMDGTYANSVPQEYYRVTSISGTGATATNGAAPAQQNVDALLSYMVGKTPEEFNAGAHKYLVSEKIADTALTNKVAFGKFAPEMLAEGKVKLEEGKYLLV